MDRTGEHFLHFSVTLYLTFITGRAESLTHSFISNVTCTQNDHRRLKSNSVKVVSEKENEGNYDTAAAQFLSPPPNKNKNMVSAPKKKNKNLLRTVLFQHRSSSSSYDPMTYYHKTPSSTLMELPPCTPLLEFNSKMEYRATPRVLLEQFDDGSGTAVSSLGITAGDFGRIASLLE